MTTTTAVAPPPLELPADARPFHIHTTRRVATVVATSAEEAAAIFTCKRWPLHVPPAPMPAQERYPEGPMSHLHRPTAAWEAWHAAYSGDLGGRLRWYDGECMVKVVEQTEAT